MDPGNDVFCYRIDFGFYDSLNPHPSIEGLHSNGDFSSLEQLGFEIRAAVDAILGRHPELSLALLNNVRGGDAAREFLISGAPEADAVIGLLNLVHANTALENNHPDKVVEWNLLADPEAEAAIVKALSGLTKTWWTGR
jgi:hypothetical protein